MRALPMVILVCSLACGEVRAPPDPREESSAVTPVFPASEPPPGPKPPVEAPPLYLRAENDAARRVKTRGALQFSVQGATPGALVEIVLGPGSSSTPVGKASFSINTDEFEEGPLRIFAREISADGTVRDQSNRFDFIIDRTPPKFLPPDPSIPRRLARMSELEIGFSEDMDLESIPSNVRLTGSVTGSIPFSVQQTYDTAGIRLRPTTQLHFAETVSVFISDQVSDSAGNPLESAQVSSFQVVDCSAPVASLQRLDCELMLTRSELYGGYRTASVAVGKDATAYLVTNVDTTGDSHQSALRAYVNGAWTLLLDVKGRGQLVDTDAGLLFAVVSDGAAPTLAVYSVSGTATSPNPELTCATPPCAARYLYFVPGFGLYGSGAVQERSTALFHREGGQWKQVFVLPERPPGWSQTIRSLSAHAGKLFLQWGDWYYDSYGPQEQGALFDGAVWTQLEPTSEAAESSEYASIVLDAHGVPVRARALGGKLYISRWLGTWQTTVLMLPAGTDYGAPRLRLREGAISAVIKTLSSPSHVVVATETATGGWTFHEDPAAQYDWTASSPAYAVEQQAYWGDIGVLRR